MGWSAGSEIMTAVMVACAKAQCTPEQRAVIYREVIPALADADCDTLDECVGGDMAYNAEYEAWAQAGGR